MDLLSKTERSWNMSRIRGRDTVPERTVRSVLHKMGYRFRLHPRSIVGKPDIVLPRYRTVLFVHGCFWHRHRACSYAYMPKSSIVFWREKFSANVLRDRRAIRKLRAQGWNVLVVWECELNDLAALTQRLAQQLRYQGANTTK